MIPALEAVKGLVQNGGDEYSWPFAQPQRAPLSNILFHNIKFCYCNFDLVPSRIYSIIHPTARHGSPSEKMV